MIPVSLISLYLPTNVLPHCVHGVASISSFRVGSNVPSLWTLTFLDHPFLPSITLSISVCITMLCFLANNSLWKYRVCFLFVYFYFSSQRCKSHETRHLSYSVQCCFSSTGRLVPGTWWTQSDWLKNNALPPSVSHKTFVEFQRDVSKHVVYLEKLQKYEL